MSFLYEYYKGSAAFNEATAMPVILENGRKVFGPPHKYYGPRPSHACELYVTRIPAELNELDFLVWLHRIGQVYAFRLMMDSGNTTRGYAFVRFCNERDALAAFELIKYLFVDGERLSVFRSQGKNRLFVNGIPREIPLTSMADGFKFLFPNMKSCTAYPPLKNKLPPNIVSSRENEENRGFAFIEFEDHEMALAAKKRMSTGRIGMWGADLKIQWARPKEDTQPSLLSRKQDLPLSFSQCSRSHEPNDYCAKLRLHCLANNLCIPVILYGASFRLSQLQYAGVLLKNSFTGFYWYFLIEVAVSNISDIHLLICEVALKIIEEWNGDLNNNTLIRVFTDSKAELVCNFKSYDEVKCPKIQREFRYPNAILDLACSLHALGLQNHEILLQLYIRSFLSQQPLATFCLDIRNPLTIYGAILPKFRNNRKLNNNFNDMEINLLLMSSSPHPDEKEESSDNGGIKEPQVQKRKKQRQSPPTLNKCQYFTLKSQFTSLGITYALQYVDIKSAENRECYHIQQRVNSNPVWISGHSFQKSIYN